MLFLLIVCLVMVLVGYGLYVHQRHTARTPSGLKKGVQALTDPEAVVQDLEK
jgi:hypothetical protein